MSILGTVAAAATFYFTGNPQLAITAYGIGAGVDAAINAPDIMGPRLEDLRVQMSSYGAPIPFEWGVNRHAGTIIWPADLTAVEHEQSQSSKGGPDTVTFKYTISCAVLLCEGPIAGVRRIWANKKIIYDVSASNAGATQDPRVGSIRFYLGTESQAADPLIEATDGTSPAYLGYAYVVFEDYDVTDLGGRPPQWEFEVVSDGATGPPPPPVYLGTIDTVPNTYSALAAIDPATGWIWTVQPSIGLVISLNITVVSDIGEAVIANISTGQGSAFNAVDICSGPNGEMYVLCDRFPNPYSERHALICTLSSGSANVDGTAAVAPFVVGWGGVGSLSELGLGNGIDPAKIAYDPQHGQILIAYNSSNITQTQMASVNPVTRRVRYFAESQSIGLPTRICVGHPYIAVTGYGGAGAANLIIYDSATLTGLFALTVTSPAPSSKPIDWDPVRKVFVVGGNDQHFDIVDPLAGTVTSHLLTTAAGGVLPYIATAAISYHAGLDRYIVGANSSGGLAFEGSTLWVVNPDTFATENVINCELTTGPKPVQIINPLLAPLSNKPYLIGFDKTNVKRLYLQPSLEPEPLPLSEIVSGICLRAGLVAGDIDVAQLTDLVDGYIVPRQMTGRAAVEPLQTAYYFDAVESDDKIKFVKRGAASAVTIPQADRAAHEQGQEMPDALSIVRAFELELPYQCDVAYADLDADHLVGNQYDRRITKNTRQKINFQLPIVMPAAKAKQVARVTLYQAWLNQGYRWSTTRKYAKYEPTDVVSLPTDAALYTAVITAKKEQPNGVIEWEGRMTVMQVYLQSGTGAATTSSVTQAIATIDATVLALLDIPLLRDEDDNAGFYVAMGGAL